VAYVAPFLRQAVVDRAGNRCEYCHHPQALALVTFEVEHITAEKHGGATTQENLALACPECNRFKGTDLGSLDPETGQLTAFFNPRRQQWSDHFQLDGARIAPISPEGRVTVAILQLNRPERLTDRQRLVEAGVDFQ
jgi:hypothetical protein